MSDVVPCSLLEPDEPPPFEVVNPDGAGRAVLVCDHASKYIPRRLSNLGVEPAALERHVAWDIGAAAVARGLSVTLDAPLVLCGYSRLVIDCNRPHWADDLFTTLSEDVEVPGNRDLTPAERDARIEEIFWPYQDAVDRMVRSRLGGPRPPVVVSVHSFTPVYHGQSRPWNIGVHYRVDDRLARLALEVLGVEETLCVGENEPYSIALDEDYTVPVHAETRGLPYVMFEIRQDQLRHEAGIEEWARRLGTLLGRALEHPSLDHHAPPAPAARDSRYHREEG